MLNAGADDGSIAAERAAEGSAIPLREEMAVLTGTCIFPVRRTRHSGRRCTPERGCRRRRGADGGSASPLFDALEGPRGSEMTTLSRGRAGAVGRRDAGATGHTGRRRQESCPRQRQTKEMILLTALRRTETDMGF